MGEGVATAGGSVIGDGVHDDPDHPPAPDPVTAPKGWTWARDERRWRARIRGPLLTVVPPQRADHDPDGPAAAAGGDGGYTRRDPDPAWMNDSSGRDPWQPPAPFEVNDDMRADIRALIALAYTIPGEALPLLDPYCFGPLGTEETTTAVISAVSDIVCGSPRIAAWAASAAGLMPWIKLGIALKPVAVAVLHHHVLKDVDVVIDREKRTMSVDKRDWSQYPAA